MNNEDNSYLIPANSKKSMLILSFFNPMDLIIFGTGALITVLLMVTHMGEDSLKGAILVLAPLLITGFLVVPIPNQHNVRTLIKNVYTYLVNRKVYYWKGWCFNSEKDDNK